MIKEIEKEILPIVVRPFNHTKDYGYILQTWSKEYHKQFPFNFIPNSIYIPSQTKLINNILSKATTIVACLDDDPDQIVGYLIYEFYGDNTFIIHWGNIKGIFRRLGVMRDYLLPIGGNRSWIVTHFFSLFKKLKDKYSLIYDPTFLERYK